MIKRKKPERKKRRWPFVLLAAALLISALIFDSYYRITGSEYELSYEKLPSAFDGYRIVQLSDLHLKQFGEDNERLLEKVAGEAPEVIVLTGDFINRRLSDSQAGQSEKLRGFFEKLTKIAPCYFISGNHEWASFELDELAAILEETGIRYLRNEFVFLEKDGERIILAGVEDPNGPADMIKPDSFVEGIKARYPGDFIVLLGHRDDWLKKYPGLPVDLILSGHAHGGVVRLPFIGGLFSTDYEFFPEYDAGLYNEGNYDFILSRGLGNFNIIPRFLNPGELVTVILHAE